MPRKKMAEPLDPKEVVNIEELTISNMHELEALIEVQVRKRIVSKEEVLEEIKKLKAKGG
jgi:isopropylmalate/homocitrate/citramalate synthase